MREVKPEVFLASSPMLREGMVDYLNTVGAGEWKDRIFNDLERADAEILVEFAGRLCYRAWEPGMNPNVTKVRTDSRAYLGNILKQAHGSVLEHANFTFILHNVSRVLTHEMVRHRAGVAVSQESMRFVRLDDIPFWFPDWAKEDEALMARATEILKDMEDMQTWMAEHFGLDDEGVPFSEKKHKTSFMRRFAPDGVATGMVVTFNIRAIRHIIYMRTSLGAEEEIRLVCDEIAETMLAEIPDLMQDYSPNEDREWIPEFLKV